MSSVYCSKCRCRMGRSKLKDGQCIDIDGCIKRMQYQKSEDEDHYEHKINIFETDYLNGRRTTLQDLERQGRERDQKIEETDSM